MTKREEFSAADTVTAAAAALVAVAQTAKVVHDIKKDSRKNDASD